MATLQQLAESNFDAMLSPKPPYIFARDGLSSVQQRPLVFPTKGWLSTSQRFLRCEAKKRF